MNDLKVPLFCQDSSGVRSNRSQIWNNTLQHNALRVPTIKGFHLKVTQILSVDVVVFIYQGRIKMKNKKSPKIVDASCIW